MKRAGIPKVLLRAILIYCAYNSLSRAHAGIYEYRAEREMGRRNFLKAADFSALGLRILPGNIELLHLNSKNALGAAGESDKATLIVQAEASARELTEKNPGFSRGWIYWAASRLKQGASFKDIQPALERGVSLEPHGAWVLNTGAKIYLSAWPDLSREEKDMTIKRFRESLSLHDPNQPSSYLDESLQVLWQQTRDFSILQAVVPDDLFSYDRLLSFTESRQLWEFRAPIFAKTQEMRRKAYDFQCRKAEREMLNGFPERAFTEFQIASWIDNARVYAEAGMLVSAYPRRFWPFDLQSKLRLILNDHEEDWAFLRTRLLRVVEGEKNPELLTQYEKWLRGPAHLENIPGKQRFEPSLWWSKPRGNAVRLGAGQMLGMPIGLQRGESRVTLNLTASAAGTYEFPYLRLRLLEKDRGRIIGEIYAKESDRKSFTFNCRSSGGKMWLQVEMMNRDEKAFAELGHVEVEAVS